MIFLLIINVSYIFLSNQINCDVIHHFLWYLISFLIKIKLIGYKLTFIKIIKLIIIRIIFINRNQINL